MDKIDHLDPATLLSRQVSGGRYFFLNLAPSRRKPMVLIMGGREQCNPDYIVERRRVR